MSAAAASTMIAATTGPARIRKLDEAVVNRIAAGEVVHRPASAVKEMMENSLDAGSTSITVTLKDGGLKLLQITDDGHGIRKQDLGIVCERFTTSKLRDFTDLDRIQTYGFRGEALASITHVAHVTIMSMTSGSPNAWKAKYSDGQLVAFKAGKKAAPVPCAGVRGTQITVQDMFYNVATRRKALSSAAEEFKRVLEVVSRYAIHFGSRGVSFTCKKHGQGLPALHTLKGNSTLQNIAAVYGSKLSQELVPFQSAVGWDGDGGGASSSGGGGSSSSGSGGGGGSGGAAGGDGARTAVPLQRVETDDFAYKASGFISNANFNRATGIFLLFINDRLVESAKLKRAFDNVYSEYLPRKRHAFVYLSITLPSHHCDVNVHPTKNQVHFLHEEALVEKLQQALAEKLRGANQSRTYYTQALLPTVIGGSTGSPRHGGGGDGDGDGGGGDGGGGAAGGGVGSPSARSSSLGGDDSPASQPATGSAGSTPSLRRGRSPFGGAGGGGGGGGDDDDPRRKKARKAAPNPSRMVRTDSRVTLVNSYFRPVSEQQGGHGGGRGGGGGGGGGGASSDDDQISGGGGGGAKPTGSLARILQRRKDQQRKKQRRGHGGCAGCPDCGDPGGDGGSVGGAGSSSKAYAAVAAVDWRKAAAAATGGGGGAAAPGAGKRRRSRPAKEIPYPPVMLTSIENLLKHVAKRGNASLRKVVAEHVYIGAVDEELALLQFNTKMYLVNHWEMSKEYWFQRAIRNFSHFPRIALQPAASLAQLLEVAFATADIHVLNTHADGAEGADGEGEGGGAEEAAATGSGGGGGSGGQSAAARRRKKQVAEAVELLVSKADMLDEYFKISITPSGKLESLPQLEPEVAHVPQLDGLPRFVYNLAFKVDWCSEQMCFRDVAEELAFLYSLLPVRQLKNRKAVHSGGAGAAAAAAASSSSSSGGGGTGAAGPGLDAADVGGNDEFADTLHPRAKQMLSQVLFPAFRAHLLPPAQWLNTHVFMEVACLQKLYRIFERC